MRGTMNHRHASTLALLALLSASPVRAEEAHAPIPAGIPVAEAAKRGDVQAQFKLGLMYDLGQDVGRNDEEAAR